MTNKQNANIRMSLVPLVIIVLVILGTGYFLFKDQLDFSKQNGLKRVRLQNFPTVIPTDKILEKKRLIIKSQDELNQFLNDIDSTGLTVVKENINFDKEWLIAVSSSTYPETGHEIKIKDIKLSQEEEGAEKKYVVNIVETEKGENCVVDKQPNVIADMVIIDHTDLHITFDRSIKVEKCDKQSTTSEESDEL